MSWPTEPAPTPPSECAPQPWSTETTLPSSGAYSFAQTPNTRPSGPLSLTMKPQVRHLARADLGPCSPEYHRPAASSRPTADSTLAGRSMPTGWTLARDGPDLRLLRPREPAPGWVAWGGAWPGVPASSWAGSVPGWTASGWPASVGTSPVCASSGRPAPVCPAVGTPPGCSAPGCSASVAACD